MEQFMVIYERFHEALSLETLGASFMWTEYVTIIAVFCQHILGFFTISLLNLRRVILQTQR